MSLFGRRSTVACFYCQSAVTPRNPRSFQCPKCTCWNRYDPHGEIVSEEPAMHDEALNARSFAKRASPNKNHLPSMASSSRRPFCHTCQTNQTLLVNLLSNYLPLPEDPTYQGRLESLPAYTASLQTRYPPVCSECLPAVEERIREKDHMARTQALGGVLKESRGHDRQRLNAQANARKLARQLFAWKIRGALWLLTLISVIGAYVVALREFPFPQISYSAAPILPGLAISSLAWTFWDPTYSLSRRSKQQGRQVRIDGRQTYIRLQFLSWICRTTTATLIFWLWLYPNSHLKDLTLTTWLMAHMETRQMWFGFCLTLELFILILSYLSIRIHQPPTVRLVDTTVRLPTSRAQTAEPQSRPTSPPPLPASEPDLFATLSLSANPVVSNYAVNPIFGQPSLRPVAQPSPMKTSPADNPDAMDWEPSTRSPDNDRHRLRGRMKADFEDDADDNPILRPQRFFAPEQPTGLEGLLMRTRLMDDGSPTRDQGTQRVSHASRWNWAWVYALSSIPVVAIAIILWVVRRREKE